MIGPLLRYCLALLWIWNNIFKMKSLENRKQNRRQNRNRTFSTEIKIVPNVRIENSQAWLAWSVSAFPYSCHVQSDGGHSTRKTPVRLITSTVFRSALVRDPAARPAPSTGGGINRLAWDYRSGRGVCGWLLRLVHSTCLPVGPPWRPGTATGVY